MQTIQELNEKFAIESIVKFKIHHKIGPILEVFGPNGVLEVSIYGGQVLNWHPQNQKHCVLWQPQLEAYRVGSPIRGGAPVCWPWFGKNAAAINMPSHGYARISHWEVKSVELLSNGDVRISLELTQVDSRYGNWHIGLKLTEVINFGKFLDIEICTENIRNINFHLSEGLHTYFNIGDINKISIGGLENIEYIDLLNGEKDAEDRAIKFDGEFGRVYVNSSDTCWINDPVYKRMIKINKRGSMSTAVWNPWARIAVEMYDLGPIEWKKMICVESANALDNVVSIPPKSRHILGVTYEVESN